MSEFNIEVEGGSRVRLLTGGKYCPEDIIVTAKGGGSTGGDIDALIDGTITEVNSGVTSIAPYALYRSPALVSGDFPNATSVGKYAFSYCENLASVNLPNATDFDTYVFYYSQALKTICLPKARSVGMRMFYGCYDLESVDFHNATSIDQEAFIHCSILTSVTLRSQTVCTLVNANSFQSLYQYWEENGSGRIYVPANLVDAYKSATNWSSLASKIVAIEGEGGGGGEKLPTPTIMLEMYEGEYELYLSDYGNATSATYYASYINDGDWVEVATLGVIPNSQETVLQEDLLRWVTSNGFTGSAYFSVVCHADGYADSERAVSNEFMF